MISHGHLHFNTIRDCACMSLSTRTRPGLRAWSVCPYGPHPLQATLGNRQIAISTSHAQRERQSETEPCVHSPSAATAAGARLRPAGLAAGPGSPDLCGEGCAEGAWGGQQLLSTTHTHTHLTPNTMAIRKRSTYEQWASLRGHGNACADDS
jgi:hypothetical protein